jgi:hypothetical protein
MALRRYPAMKSLPLVNGCQPLQNFLKWRKKVYVCHGTPLTFCFVFRKDVCFVDDVLVTCVPGYQCVCMDYTCVVIQPMTGETALKTVLCVCVHVQLLTSYVSVDNYLNLKLRAARDQSRYSNTEVRGCQVQELLYCRCFVTLAVVEGSYHLSRSGGGQY